MALQPEEHPPQTYCVEWQLARTRDKDVRRVENVRSILVLDSGGIALFDDPDPDHGAPPMLVLTNVPAVVWRVDS